MKGVVNRILKGWLLDPDTLKTGKYMPDFAKKIACVNWSMAIAPYNGDGLTLLLSDFDSMAINLSLLKLDNRKMPFVYLENFVVDVENMVAYDIG